MFAAISYCFLFHTKLKNNIGFKTQITEKKSFKRANNLFFC